MSKTRADVRRIGLVLSVSILVFCLGATTFAEIVGDSTKLDPLLRRMMQPLDKQGIDVVGGDAADVVLSKASRPRVARLVGMPTPDRDRDWRKVGWMRDFETGAAGFVAGVRSSGAVWAPVEAPKSEEKFLVEWNKAIPERRIFLSFTSADAAHAHAAAKALSDAGYVTFVFLRVGDEKAPFDAGFVGRMFAEAGQRMVIDTKSARKSEGVWFEARLAQGKTPPAGEPMRSPSAPSEGPGDREGPQGRTPPRGGRPVSPVSGPATSPEMEEFLRGVERGWIVTENPNSPGKLFVHRSSNGGMLTGLVYLVKVEKDGTWTVHRPRRGRSGSEFGERVGAVRAPRSVSVGTCGCM